MKRYLVYILLCISFYLKAQCFKVYSNLSGSNLTLNELNEINIALSDIVLAFENKNINFNILEYSNYQIGGYFLDNTVHFANVIEDVDQEYENYILIGRIYNNSLYPEIEVKVKFHNDLDCFDQGICSEIEKVLKYSLIKNSNQSIKDQYINTFAKYENNFTQRIECCASRIECQQLFDQNQDYIIDELYENGYSAYPIYIEEGSLVLNNSNENSRSPCNVIDNNTTPFSINGTTAYNIKSFICSYSHDLNAKYYISDNKSYSNTFQAVKNDIGINNYDLAAHFHIYDSSDPDKIPDLILWKDYSSSYHTYFQRSNAGGIAVPFNFTSELPVISSDIIPNYPEFIDEFWAGMLETDFFLTVNSRANQLSIPAGNITIYSFPNPWWVAATSELPFQGQWEYIQAFLIKEYEEGDKIFAISTADCGNISKYFGYDNNGNYICSETQHADDNLFYHDDGKPYLDNEIIEKKGPSIALAGGNVNLIKYAKNFKKKVKNKAYVINQIGYAVYEITIGQQVYIGTTTRQVGTRMLEHIDDVVLRGKWASKGIKLSKLTMREIIQNTAKLIDEIPDKTTLKGLEQLFIELDDLTIKGLNKINAINVKKKAKFRNCLTKAKNFIKNDEKAFDLFKIRYPNKNIDQVYNEIVNKYGL